MKILENAEINEHGQAVLSADEYADVCREVSRLTAEVERLREYAQHLPDCDKSYDPFKGKCDCGLDKAITGEE